VVFFQEFLVADDFNKITSQGTYVGHQARIHAVYFSPRNESLLSVCRERKFNWYSTNPVDENHQNPLGSYTLTSSGMSIAMDESNKECFIGDSNGIIHYLKMDVDNKSKLCNTFSGHTG
jgi:hypothetical protein